MPDREKVIEGLEHCGFNEKRGCVGCPYSDECGDFGRDAGMSSLATDALALLREQEPRVMTLEEVQEDELVWIEVPQSDEIWPALLREADWFGHPKWAMCGYAIARSFLRNRYGKDWRCWTARPTDEQRKAVKWDAPD